MAPPEPERITRQALDAMVEHARREEPLECCGFLTGEGKLIDRAEPMPNADRSPTRFSVAPQDLFAFFRRIRESPRRLLGIYHSHPASEARPSARDVTEFHYPEAGYWIVSLASSPPAVRCYRWVRMGFEERRIAVEDAEKTHADPASSRAASGTDMEDYRRNRQTPETDVFAKLRDSAPPRLLEFLDQTLMFIPEGFRYRLKQVVDSLPDEGDNMQKILEVVRAQWKNIQSDQIVQIAVTGPLQTGKTSLLKALLRRKAGDADPIFTIVETPGLEEYLGYGSEAIPPELAEADLILLVLDARYGISQLTGQILEKLRELGKPILVVLNKIDLVEDGKERLKEAKKALQTSVFATSIHRESTLDNLLKAMVAACPKALYPLAQSFPDFRRTLCNGIVTQASFAVGLVGLVPIPVSDLLPNTAIQTAMILKIARAFGCELNRERARELVPMLAAGLLAREAGHRLRRLFPRQKELIGVMLGGSATYLMGRVAVRYFESMEGVLRGGDLSKWEPLPSRS